MPKSILKLSNFHGGINNDSAATDIADNEFAELTNAKIDEVGKITLLGACVTDVHTSASMAIDVGTASGIEKGGRGLAIVETDYNKLEDNANDVNTGADEGSGATAKGHYQYLVNETATGVQFTQLDDLSETGHMICGNNSLKTAMPEIFYQDGALRVYDAASTPAVPRWRGHIDQVQYGTNSSGTNILYQGHVNNGGANQWYSADARIKGAFEELTVTFAKGGTQTVGKNLIAGSYYAQGGLSATPVEGQASVFGFADEITDTGNNDGTATSETSYMFWGHGLLYREAGNGSGSWCPNGTESYQFYCTTIYDGKQESLPQLFSMWPTGRQAGGPHNHAEADWKDAVNKYSNDSATLVGSLNFGLNTDLTAAPTEGIKLQLYPTIKWGGAAHSAANSGNYAFGASTNNLVRDASLTAGGDPRITGIKVYYAESTDGFSTKWELYEWDFAKGFKSAESGGGGSGSYNLVDWTSAHNVGLAGSNTYHYQHPHAGPDGGAGVEYTDPPKVRQYDIEVGHSSDETIHIDGMVTSAFCNGRIYAGGVTVDGKTYGDKIIRSQVGEYDKFPFDTGDVTVVSNDGDRIVKLAEYADRILEFKQNVLYILNVAGEHVFLEATNKYKGVTNPGMVASTDFGVAWANENGCYLYNGQQVIDILEKEGIRKISKTAWQDHVGEYSRVGYNPETRHIVVVAGGASANGAYIYDMTTRAWMYRSSFITDPNTGSNFHNLPGDGKLIICDDGNDKIQKYGPGADSTSVTIITKSFDFGQPAVRKKIYKVYITYKNGAGSAADIDVFYGINGAAPTTDGFNTHLGDTNGAFAVREFNFNPGVTDVNSAYTFQLKIHGNVHSNFEIQDISIVYRLKNIK